MSKITQMVKKANAAGERRPQVRSKGLAQSLHCGPSAPLADCVKKSIFKNAS